MSDSECARAQRDVTRELLELLSAAATAEDFLVELARLAVAEVGPALACGLSVWTPRPRYLAATSSELARRMEQIQYDLDEGPCLTCLRDNSDVEVSDIVTDPRWAAFSRCGRTEGVGASLSVPLRAAGRAIGALTLYAREAGAFADSDRTRAGDFAVQSAGAVVLASRFAESEQRGRHLENALTSRTTIDQALGIVMGQHRIGAEQAFDFLRRRSQQTNTKLRDVAANLIVDVTGEGPRTYSLPPT